jgi:hypothetical protein
MLQKLAQENDQHKRGRPRKRGQRTAEGQQRQIAARISNGVHFQSPVLPGGIESQEAWDSPDLADAFCMAFNVRQAMSYSWLPYDDSRFREIAEKHGWDWSSSVPDNDDSYADRRNWNRPPPSEDLVGFGGVWSIW